MSHRKKSYWKSYRKLRSTVAGHIDFIYNEVENIEEVQNEGLQNDSVSVVIDLQECVNISEPESGHIDCDQAENSESDTSDCDIHSLSDVSDDGDDSLSDVSDSETDLFESLANWASKFNIAHSALRELLQFLNKSHPTLPKDPRTLLQTKKQYEVREIAGGFYHHFGVADGVRVQLLNQQPETFPGRQETVLLQINIDGLPLFKSGNTQFWPILGRIVSPFLGEPFVVGLFSGQSKPADIHAFLQDFIVEMNELRQSPLNIPELDCIFQVHISCVICDTPARAYVKQVKGHSGYYGCDKCTQKGLWLRKMTFPDMNADLRTDIQFDEMSDPSHHLGPSPFSNLDVGLVSQFPLDFMHLVCLGVVKRLLAVWMKGPLENCRIAASSVRRISENVLNLRTFLPREFLRKGRSLHEVDRWKATEYRQFLLYTGPIALQNVLSRASYQHFMKLFIGIYCLSSPFFCRTYLAYANEILHKFVVDFAKLYGDDMLVYNVHGLLHLAKDVEKFGPLDNFSAFVFESFLGKLKRLVRKPNFPLQQVIRRMSERRNYLSPSMTTPSHGLVSKMYLDGPCPPNMLHYQQFRELQLPTVFLSVKLGDNCILVGGKVALVKNILCANAQDKKYIVYEEFGMMSNFFDSPLESGDLMIYYVSELSGDLKICEVSDISLIFTDENNVAIVPDVWLEGTSCAVWPEHIKAPAKLMRAVLDKLPPDNAWPAYPIRELYRNESFSEVRKRLKRAEERSDLESTAVEDESDGEGAKRRSKRKRRPTVFSSSDEDDRQPLETVVVEKPPKPLQPPRGTFGQKTTLWSAASDGSRDAPAATQRTTLRATNSLSPQMVTPALNRASPSPSSHRATPSPSSHRATRSPTPQRVTCSPPPQRPTYSPSPQRATPFAALNWETPSPSSHRATPSPSLHRATRSPPPQREPRSPAAQGATYTPSPLRATASVPQRVAISAPASNDLSSTSSIARDIRLFTTLEQMKAEQAETKELLQQMICLFKQFTTSSSANTAGAVPEETSFPLTTVPELQGLEEKLEDSSVFNGLVSYLTVLGGRSTVDATRRIMGKMVHSSLGIKYNFNGKKGKLAFGRTHTCSVIQRAVLKTCRTATMAEVEVAIREWFRTASDRDGGRKKRAQKTRERSLNEAVLEDPEP